jgi:hypothetical protein
MSHASRLDRSNTFWTLDVFQRHREGCVPDEGYGTVRHADQPGA